MKIYVAGPLNAKDAPTYIKNLSKMLKVGVALREKGHQPYVPGLDILLGLISGNWEYTDYTEMNMGFVDACDAIFIIAPSPGTNKELERAIKLNLFIFRSIDCVPEV